MTTENGFESRLPLDTKPYSHGPAGEPAPGGKAPKELSVHGSPCSRLAPSHPGPDGVSSC
jgi:hypothetical protein